VFKLTDLEEHFGKNMEINGSIYTLEKMQDLSGVLAVWKNDSYLIYATPAFDGVAVPVHIVDCNNQEIGTDGYYPEIESYERYCKIVKVLSEKILRRARM
jgi:hypothetical protein